jgi:hypothetical protein
VYLAERANNVLVRERILYREMRDHLLLTGRASSPQTDQGRL